MPLGGVIAEPKPLPAEFVDAVFDCRTGYHVITKPAGWFDKHPDGEGNGAIFEIRRGPASELGEENFWRDIDNGRVPLQKLDRAKVLLNRQLADSPTLLNVYRSADVFTTRGVSAEDLLAETRRFDTRRNALLTVGTGKTYSTISAAITAGSTGDIIECYATTANTYTENVVISAKQFQIVGMVADQGLTITKSSGIVVANTTAGGAHSLLKNFTLSATGTATMCVSENQAMTLENCIGSGGSVAVFGLGHGSSIARNCIATSGVLGFRMTGAATCYHCTAVGCTTGFNASQANGGWTVACLAANNTTGFGTNLYALGCLLNASEDATAPGGGSVTGFLDTDLENTWQIKASVAATTKVLFDGYPFAVRDASGQTRKTSGTFFAGADDPDPVVDVYPTSDDVLLGSGVYGPGGSGYTPSYGPDFPEPENVLTIDSTDNVLGTFDEAARNTGTAAGNIVTGASIKIQNATTDGTRADAAAGNVLAGSGTYGDPGAPTTPTYSPDFPAVANVRTTDTVDGAAGTCTVPAAGDLKSGAQCGAAGTEVTGTRTDCPIADARKTTAYGDPAGQLIGLAYIPAAADVRKTVPVDQTTGLAYIPAAADVRKDVVVDQTVGLVNVPAAADVLKDVPVDQTVGLFDESARNVDPGVAKVDWDTSYKIHNVDLDGEMQPEHGAPEFDVRAQVGGEDAAVISAGATVTVAGGIACRQFGAQAESRFVKVSLDLENPLGESVQSLIAKFNRSFALDEVKTWAEIKGSAVTFAAPETTGTYYLHAYVLDVLGSEFDVWVPIRVVSAAALPAEAKVEAATIFGYDDDLTGELDVTEPSAGSITTATAGDGQVALVLVAAAPADVLYVRYCKRGEAWSARSETFKCTGSGSVTVTGLTNDVPYNFSVESYDGSLYGPFSTIVSCMPISASESELDEILAAVAAAINDLTLLDSAGHALAASIEVPPNFENVSTSCIKVFPDRDELHASHSELNEAVYRVAAVVLEGAVQDSETSKRQKALKNRQTILDSFVGSRLAGMTTVYCRGGDMPSALDLDALWARFHAVSAIILEFVILRNRS